jgi:hypothetical protein
MARHLNVPKDLDQLIEKRDAERRREGERDARAEKSKSPVPERRTRKRRKDDK